MKLLFQIDSLGKEDLLLYISQALNIKVTVVLPIRLDFYCFTNYMVETIETLTQYRFGYGQNDYRSCIFSGFMKSSRPGPLLQEFVLFLVTVLRLKLLKRWMTFAQL